MPSYAARVWARRDLLRLLAWREVKAGRRQSVLGLAWIFLQPAGYLLVLSLVFSRFGRADIEAPYPLYLLAGLVPWLFVLGSVNAATKSVVAMGALVRKVAFPRILCPLSVMAAHLTNLLAGLVFLAALMAWYGRVPGLAVLWIAPALGVAAALAAGLGFLLSALNVHTRDVESALPLVMQLWFFATPIIYPLEWVAEPLARRGLLGVYELNPMLGVVETVRSAVSGAPPPPELAWAALVAGAVFVLGLAVFTRLERNFADVI
jgi:lipopolysaccharide transport system permease protein